MQEGDRVAQLVIEKICNPDVLEVEVGLVSGVSSYVMLIVRKEPRRDTSGSQRFRVNRWTRSTNEVVINTDD